LFSFSFSYLILHLPFAGLRRIVRCEDTPLRIGGWTYYFYFYFSYQLYCIIFAMLVVAFPLAVPPLVFHADV